MEENTSLFSLSIDPVTKTHLTETAKWARFLAIVGFLCLLLLIVFGVVTSLTISRYEDLYTGYNGRRSMMQGLGVGMAIIYILIAVIAFFPFLFMFRFASQMRNALYANDQNLLNSSFQNLKVYFRYVGIITIIALVLMAFSIFMQIVGRAI